MLTVVLKKIIIIFILACVLHLNLRYFGFALDLAYIYINEVFVLFFNGQMSVTVGRE